MIDLLSINKEVVFEPVKHTYHKNGKELTSVSSLISRYKPIFDEFGHIKRACAKRDGITVEELQAKWDKERDDACDRGHSLHSQLEHFIKTGAILDDDYKDVVTQFSKIKFKGKLHSEVGIHNEKYMISGTTDLVELLPNNVINIGDFKQNKRMDKKSRYNTKLLYPLDEYDECEYQIYTIQLNLYSFMLEGFGYKTKNMTLYYVNRKTRELEIYPVPHIKKDIKLLLNHFKAMKSW